MEMLVRSLSKFPNYPISLQIVCASFFWFLVGLLANIIFSSFALEDFVLENFQCQECWPFFWPLLSLSITLLATFFVSLIVFSAKIVHQAVQHFTQIKTLWQIPDKQSLNIPSLNHASKLYLCDLIERELNLRARNVISLIDRWYSEISDNEEFTKDIQNQVEDILSLLISKLSNIEVEIFLKNLIFIVHSHLRAYLVAVEACKKSGATVVDLFYFTHPVSRGEVSLEQYLNCQSQVVLREYIPGSVQDCHSVYSLICAAFSSQILFKFVNHLMKPENILESIIRMLDSLPMPSVPENNCVPDSVPVNLDNIIQQTFTNSSEEISPIEEPQDEPISDANFDASDEDEKECLSLPDEEEWNGERNASPILAGNFVYQPTAESCVKTGLSLSLSTLTAPLLPQCGELHSCEGSPLESGAGISVNQFGPYKPNSLPVVSNGGTEGSKSQLSLEDVSPVYEDVEDFATAIAKLRSLLEQRESNGGDNPRNTSSSPDARISSSGGETESSFEELTEASEIPADSRIFLNIKIPRTELMTQGSEGQHSVYCITYDGIYTAISSSRVEDSSVMKTDTRLVLKSRTVRRRFRQFLQLHEQLERSDNPMIQQAMRTIRGPSKWLNLPFSRVDQNTVAHRRMFLERYLQHLCSSVHIGTSIELRLFLEYELHANDIGSSNSVPSPRVPFLAKTVSVLQSIKTALPGFDTSDQVNPVQLIPLPPPTPLAHSESIGDRDFFNYKSSSTAPTADDVDSDFKCNVIVSSEISPLEQLLSTYVYHIDCRIESAYEAVESHMWRSESNVHSPEAVLKENAQSVQQVQSSVVYPVVDDGWDRFDNILPISSSLINLVFECLSHRETWITRAPIPFAIKVFFGHWMEREIQTQIRKFADPDKLSDNVELLRKKLKERAAKEQDTAAASPNDVQALHLNVVELVKSRIPGLVSGIIGREMCNETVTAVISCLTHAQLNRDLALTFLDFFLSQISTSSQQ